MMMSQRELTRVLQWLATAYPGTRLSDVVRVGETTDTQCEPTTHVEWLDAHKQAHWWLVRDAWLRAQ